MVGEASLGVDPKAQMFEIRTGRILNPPQFRFWHSLDFKHSLYVLFWLSTEKTNFEKVRIITTI